MMLKLPMMLLSAASLTLAGCATTAPPVEVTRFHNNLPAWEAGTRYQVDRAPLSDPAQILGSDQASLEWNAYLAAVERQLAAKGFVPAPQGASAPIKLRVGFDRYDREKVAKRSPVSVGVGGSTGGYGSGVGLGIGLNLGGGKSRDTQDISLFVRLDDGTTGQAIWEGGASGTVSAKATSQSALESAEKLAQALFKDFPGESGRTIMVP